MVSRDRFSARHYTPTGTPRLNLGQLAAAHLLWDAVQKSGQRENWEQFDRVLAALVGWSDNLTLRGFETLIAEAGISRPVGYWTADPDRLMNLLVTRDYGQQSIRGQLQRGSRDEFVTLPHPVSFMLMGQRFTPESDVMEQLVYDRLVVNGVKVRRAYPQPLDVMFALGNNRAADHLADELEHYGYKPNLDALRAQISSYSAEYWESSFYSLWLAAIRALNAPLTGNEVPPMTQSGAWADKMLHTELASWTTAP